jgi:tonB-linked outer membrane protein, susC/ragA family
MEKNEFSFPPDKKMGGRVHFMLFLAWLLFSGMSNLYAQKVNVNVQDGALADVFKSIQSQTDYRFMYSTQDVAPYKNITVQMKDVEVEEVLKVVLRKTDLVYVFEKAVVFIKKRPYQDPVTGVELSGKVTDKDKNPLPGVTVVLEGTLFGTTTNEQGSYLLVIPKRDSIVLVYSFVGMKTQKVKYRGQKEIDVVMEEDVTEMDEVVVTGYQTMRKGDVVGSVTTVKAADIMMPGYTSIDQMLQGRVAGMMVMNTSSRVGTNPKIRVRGTSTILGNQDPLWVVDGIIQPDPITIDQNDLMVNDLKTILGNQISWLNPADIETITVLKDASATAIYGSKAANGVIVITTKRGQQDRMTVNYNATFSFRARPHYGLFNLMNSQERIQFSEEAYAAGALYSEAPLLSSDTYEGIMQLLYKKELTSDEAKAAIQRLEGVNTNWFKLLTRNSFSHNHNLSVVGGSAKVTYRASLGYNDQAGVELDNDAKNLSGRLNIGVQMHPKVHVDVNLTGAINKTRSYAAGVDPVGFATGMSRALPAYNEDGSYYFYRKRAGYRLNSRDPDLGYNILNEMEHSYSKNKSSNLNASLNFSWDVLPWLKYEFVGGLNNTSLFSESYAGEQTFYVAEKYRGYDFGTEEYGSERYKAAMLPFGGELYNSARDVLGWNIQNKVNIQKVFKEDHRINLLLGTEISSTATKDRSNKIFGYVAERGERIVEPTPMDEIVPIGYGDDMSRWGILQDLYNGNGWTRTTSTTTQFSLFATLAYSYLDRYVLNASIRNDASNRFGQDQNKRFDPTYSFGLSWNIAREPWLNSISKFLNQFTLRASYGIQGNAVNSISPDLILTQGSIKNYYGKYQSTISRLPNPDLSWERTKSWNFGVDLQLVQWISMNFEYYTKKSDNIVTQEIALEYGLGSTEINGGRVENSGVEYSLNITPVRGKDWGWTVGLNSSKNWNKARVQSLANFALGDYLFGGGAKGGGQKVVKKGYPLSAFWSYSFKGLNHDTGLPEFNLLYQLNEDGSVKKDNEGNPVLADASELTDFLVYSGKLEPDFTGGLTTRVRWKGLTFGANFSLLLGAKKRLTSPYPDTHTIPLSNQNLDKGLLKRWKNPGDEEFTNIPSLFTGRILEYAELPLGQRENLYTMWSYSDALVVSANFLRCQQMTLSWNVDDAWCARLGLKSLQLNATMNNVFVIASKKFNGFDPELGNSIQPKTYSIGVNIGF